MQRKIVSLHALVIAVFMILAGSVYLLSSLGQKNSTLKHGSSGGETGKTRTALPPRGAKKPLHPYPGNVKADIWVFSGQSNSQGWALLKAPVEADPRILFFNAENRWVLAEEPLNKDFYRWTPGPAEQNILLQRYNVRLPQGIPAATFLEKQNQKSQQPLGGVGPALFFAKHLLKYIDRPIGLISFGVGSSIKKWDPALKHQGVDCLYGNLMERIGSVGEPIRGIIWYQGESDALTPGGAEDYEKALLKLVDSIRSDTGIADLPFIYVQLGRFSHPYDSHGRNWEKVRETQRQVASLRKNMYMVSAIDLTLDDSIHLGFEAYQRIGPRLAEIALSNVYQQPGHGAPIDLESVEVLQPENRRPMIRVRFSGVSGRLTAAGRPAGFVLRARRPSEDPSRLYPQPPAPDVPLHTIYRVDFDPADPAAVILGIFDNSPILLGKPHPLNEPLSLIYGSGTDPYVNIVDEKDIPIPAFGPIELKLPRAKFTGGCR